MNTWFTSDTHYGHKNILRFCPPRGFLWQTIEHMDAGLIERHNAVVGVADHVYHLGDFAFAPQGRIREILAQLNGRIHILKGNHDKAFNEGFQHSLVNEGYVESFIPACHKVKVEKKVFILNHYAMRVWDRSHYGTIHLYGHSHGTLPGVGKSVDVGVDSVELADYTGEDLRPWNFQEIIDFMDSKPTYMPDHHNERTT